MPKDPRPHEVELAETFAEVARSLLGGGDVDATLRKVCDLAVQTVDGCECAGISVVRAKTIRPLATTNEVPGIVDAIQSETQQGPCIDAIKEHEVFLTSALSAEARWPEFAHRAHRESGIESILSLRLFAQEDTMGALNMYSSLPDAFDDHDVAIGSVFAAHAAVAMAAARQEEQLDARADSRDIIGMAKGMIIARRGVSEDEAFDILRRASQRMNVKLRDLAEQMVHKPEQPASPTE